MSGIAIAIDHGQLLEKFNRRIIPAAMVLAGGIAACGVLLGLTALIERQGIDRESRRLLAELRDGLAAGPIPPARALSPDAGRVGGLDHEAMAQMLPLLEEIRDISLLSPQQRHDLRERLFASRRQAAITHLDMLIQQARWTEASAALEQATAMLGDSPDLAATRERLAAAMQAAESTELGRLRRLVLELQAAEKWDEAIAASGQFLERFPQSTAGRELYAQVVQTRNANVDSVANRLYEQIRFDIERRAWRSALDASQQLLGKCPNHPRAIKIQAQLDIIRDNAEIEQRNETEARIHDLVKAGRVKEAIELGEELIDSYPHSPQAKVVSELLERLYPKLEHQQMQSV